MDSFLKLSEPAAIQWPPGSGVYTCFFKGNHFINTVSLPEIQRELDLDWKKNLRIKMDKEFIKKNYYDFGTLVVCFFLNNYYLINGQHRYYIISDLLKENINNIVLKVEIRQVFNSEEMNNLWINSNHSKSVSILQNTNTQCIVNSLRKEFCKKFGSYVSNSKRPHICHINLNAMADRIDALNIISKLNIKNVNELFVMILELNDYYKSVEHINRLWKNTWKLSNIKIEDRLAKCREKSPSDTLYIGIWRDFEWLDRILTNKLDSIQYEDMKHCPRNVQPRKISPKLRQRVWSKRNDMIKGNCYVCNHTLQQDSFQCGHIKAYYYGGETTYENLEPICSSCNIDMSTENLLSYKKRLYN